MGKRKTGNRKQKAENREEKRQAAPSRSFLISAFCFLFSLCGCEKQAAEIEARPKQDLKDAASAPVDASLDSISPGTSSLAAQMQRDVDLILKSREAGGQVKYTDEVGGGAVTSSTAARQPSSQLPSSQLPSSQKAVVWNDPRGGGQSSAPVNPPAAAERKAAAEPASASNAAATSTASPPAPQAAGPTAGTLAADRLKALMVDLSRELYANGSYSATPLRELLMIAAMSMLDPQRAVDPQSVPDLTEKERELLGKLQEFFASLGRSLENNSDTEAAIVEAVAKLREALVKQPTLRLPAALLCTRVSGFGDYTPFEKYVFLAQSQQKAILYLEIADFLSELNAKGEYVTQIAQQLTIYSDRDGIPVWKEDWQTAVDVTKVKRQDFFTVQVITLPKALSVGKFHLKVRVRDEKSLAEAETTISFEMVADPRMAVGAGK